MPQTLPALLARYSHSHQHPTNKRIHRIAVPAIMFSIVGGLSLIPTLYLPFPLENCAHLLIAFAGIYYARLSPRLALGMLCILIGMAWLCTWLLVMLGVAGFAGLMAGIFVAAWIAQFVGHYYEGAKPSFFEDLQYLLIGPVWVLAPWFARFKIDD